MKKLILVMILVCVLALGSSAALAQSEISIFFVACEDRAVLDFSGTMASGFSVYYQVFSGTGASGAALTALRRVDVSGGFTVSQVVQYESGQRVGMGQFASARVSIARTNNPDSSVFTTTVEDVQDGCGEPSYGLQPSSGTGTAGVLEPARIVSDSGIMAPDGSMLNPVFSTPAEPVVLLGARPSERDTFEAPGRTANPGLIFAECDAFPLADPGTLYDTDNLLVFWSWFASTAAQVRDHIANARYAITMNNQPFTNVQLGQVVRRGRNYWVFYTVPLGSTWPPGDYRISFKLEWDQPITDGYEDFGPGTANESFETSCSFTISPNPWGISVPHRPPYPMPGD